VIEDEIETQTFDLLLKYKEEPSLDRFNLLLGDLSFG
jgi:hypothetical protein